MKVCILTLGCKVNTYESELIKENFKRAGYEITTLTSDAGVIVINTCTVTNQSDAKSRKLIRQARRESNNAILVVCGCSAEHNKDTLLELGIDILIGNKDKSQIVSLVEEFKQNHKNITKFYDLRTTEFEDMQINNFEGRTRGFVKIQDGCNNFCAYCIIPFMRGSIRSKDIEVAVEEINCLVNNGYQEIVLTGIHTGSYGEGTDYNLVDLIRRISFNKDLKRIRISSIEITELNDLFIEELQRNPKLCDHMHVPIQSGTDKILKLMNRKYEIKDYKEKIATLRSIRPNINITTDLIVGFPNETDEDFAETINNLKEIGFSKIHTFPYSIRTGTKASMMDNQVKEEIKKERVRKILVLSDTLEKEYYQKFIGSSLEVLVEDGTSGFTSNYIKVHLNENQIHNTMVLTKIESVMGTNVNGSVINCKESRN